VSVVNLSSEAAAAVLEGSQLKLCGEINVQSVADLYASGIKAFISEVKSVDCSAIKSADSCCLALLLYLQSLSDQPLIVHSLPEELTVLLDLYDLHNALHFN